MIFRKNKFFFRSLRVLYQEENLEELLDKSKYDFITVIAYDDLGLEKKGFELKHKKLANIYLDGTIEEICNRFARATWQEIAKTYKIPELEFKIADPDKETTFRLYQEFERAQGRKPWGKDSFSDVMNFNAYYNGEMIASVPCYDLFPCFQVRAMFSKRMEVGEKDKEFYKIIGHATRRLIYEICKYGKERNYTFVGLGSINYSTPQKANVANFKMFFGSKEGDEYTYTYKSKKFATLVKISNILQNMRTGALLK